jgi:ABC-type glycerol-3-phosphate transport system substrate-binding protein
MQRCSIALLALAAVGLLAGCLNGSGSTPGGGSGGGGGGKNVLQFWHTRRGDQEKTLKAICADFNRQNPGYEIQPIYQGNYDQLLQKVRAAIQGKSLPALSVGYESQVLEYMRNGALEPMETFVKDPKDGLSEGDLTDFEPQYLESNRYQQFGGKLLSFPFTKSVLLLYYNAKLLKDAGFDKPAETWDEFEKQAAAITAKTGKPAFVFDSDPSTLDGMIYSFGGELLTPDGKTRFTDRPTRSMLEMLKRMKQAKTLVWAAGDDASNLFLSGGVAYSTGTSSTRAQAETQIGNRFDWDVAVIPHGPGVKPVTVMYGPNVCIFKATPEREQAAWRFVKYFVSPEVTARWARETGYLPVRKSVLDLPEMKSFYQQHPRALHVLDAAKVARGEPNVLGWQEVRDLLKAASDAMVNGSGQPAAAAGELKEKADKALAESK